MTCQCRDCFREFGKSFHTGGDRHNDVNPSNDAAEKKDAA
jgi:hypothetical protein